MKTQRAVIYCRVSTEEQVDGTGMDVQRIACLVKAEQIGAVVVGVCDDPGVSGGLFEARPGLQKALSAIREGDADILLCYNISRLSRDVEHQAVILKQVRAAGAQLVFCDMNFEDTPTGNLALTINGAFAEYERAVIRDRIISGKLRRVAEGKQPARSFRPFGYTIVTTRHIMSGQFPLEMAGQYVVNEEEAVWIREMFRRYASGSSLRQVQYWLHETGVPTPRGGQAWNTSTMRGILQNPVYKGMATYGKRERRTDETRLQQGCKHASYHVTKPEEKWLYIPVPPIIDEQTWETCQEFMKTNRERTSGNPKRCFMLTGSLLCPYCKHPMTTSHHYKKNCSHYHCRYYAKCTNVEGIVCYPKHFNTRPMEQRVLQGIRYAASAPESIAAAIEAQRRRAVSDTPIENTEKLKTDIRFLEDEERATVKAQISAVKRGARTEVYEELLSDLARKRSAMTARLEAAKARRTDTMPADNVKDIAAFTAKALSKLDAVLSAEEITTDEKRQLLRTVVQHIIPTEDEIKITLRPFAAGNQTVQNISSRSSSIPRTGS